MLGSGKTHTISGDQSEEGKGLIPRMLEAIFDKLNAKYGEGVDRCSSVLVGYAGD